jgi:hypothetical protein
MLIMLMFIVSIVVNLMFFVIIRYGIIDVMHVDYLCLFWDVLMMLILQREVNF